MFNTGEQVEDTTRALLSKFEDSGHCNFEYLTKVCCAMIHDDKITLDKLQLPVNEQQKIIQQNNLIDWTMSLPGIAKTEDCGVVLMCLENLAPNINRLLSHGRKFVLESPTHLDMFKDLPVENENITNIMNMIKTNSAHEDGGDAPVPQNASEASFSTVTLDKTYFKTIYDFINGDKLQLETVFKPIFYDLASTTMYKEMTYTQFLEEIAREGYVDDTVSYAATMVYFFMQAIANNTEVECSINDKIRGETFTIVLNEGESIKNKLQFIRESAHNNLGYVMKVKAEAGK